MAKTKVHGEYLQDSVVRFTAKAGENITKGQPVYISGISGELPVVSLADADDTAKMPAFGLAEATVSTNAEVEVTSFGTLAGLDTSTPGYSLGDILYVDTTAGALTNDPAGLEATKLQNIGIVQRVHASNGSIKVGGAGRTNAVPNLNDGDIFIGDSNNKAISSSLATEIESYLDGGTSTPTFTSATISGNLTVDTNVLSVNSTSNTVGIGTTANVQKLTVAVDDSYTDIASGYAPLELVNTNGTNGTYSRIYFTDVAGGPGSGIIGVKLTDTTNNYGQFEFWTRGSSGFDTRMAIDPNGYVGINNTVASTVSGGYTNLVVGSGSASDSGISILTNTSGTGRIHFADGTTTGDRYDGFIAYKHNDRELLIGAGTAGGTVAYFSQHGFHPNPSNQGSSTAANALDDYEHGTYSHGSLAAYGVCSAISQGSFNNNYVKVGKLITITGIFSCSFSGAGKAIVTFFVPNLGTYANSGEAVFGSIGAYPKSQGHMGIVIPNTSANNTQWYGEFEVDSSGTNQEVYYTVTFRGA